MPYDSCDRLQLSNYLSLSQESGDGCRELDEKLIPLLLGEIQVYQIPLTRGNGVSITVALFLPCGSSS